MTFLSDAVRLSYHLLPAEEQTRWEREAAEWLLAGYQVMVLSATKGDLGSEVIIRVYK